MHQGAGIEQGHVVSDLHPRANRAWNPLARALMATGDRWTLMIVLALAPGTMRLTHLQRRLPGVSTGVLERYLQQMAALGLLTRTRYKEMPPRVEFELTETGRELVPIAEALARWGMRRMWSAPGQGERVSVDALLELLPSLLDNETDLTEGSIEVRVLDCDPPIRHRFHLRAGRLEPDGGNEDGSRAYGIRRTAMEGDQTAWVAALGPDADIAQLRVTGDKRLARRLLETLSGRT